MSAPIDLSLLPAPQVVEVLDFEAILEQRKSNVVALMPLADRDNTTAMLELESEPAVKLLEENSYQEIVLRNRVNDAAKAVMLPYATDADLDNIGANNNVPRLTVIPGNPDAVPPVAEVKEDDDSYRLRIQESPDRLSVAGPRAAYEALARSADGRIKDVSATSPAPCEIVITVLAAVDDGVPPTDLLAAVDAVLSDEEVRPLGDLVTTQAASIVDYEVEAILFVRKGPEAELSLAAAQKNVAAISAPRRPLGFGIYRTAYIAALKVEGVIDVVLSSPAENIMRNRTQAARCTAIRISTQVIEESDDE